MNHMCTLQAIACLQPLAVVQVDLLSSCHALLGNQVELLSTHVSMHSVAMSQDKPASRLLQTESGGRDSWCLNYHVQNHIHMCNLN